MIEDGDRDLASVSASKALALVLALGCVIAGLVALIVFRVLPVIGWSTFYMPIVIPIELAALGLSAYLVLVGLCLASGRGGLLRTRGGALVYLGLFRFKLSDIDRVVIEKVGPLGIPSAVMHLRKGGKRNLSLALADRPVEELQRFAP